VPLLLPEPDPLELPLLDAPELPLELKPPEPEPPELLLGWTPELDPLPLEPLLGWTPELEPLPPELGLASAVYMWPPELPLLPPPPAPPSVEGAGWLLFPVGSGFQVGFGVADELQFQTPPDAMATIHVRPSHRAFRIVVSSDRSRRS
jgi:hypothetical protein